MDYKATTNKLGSSRLLKLTLIGIGILLFIKLLSYSLIAWIIFLTSSTIDVEKVRVYLSIIDTLDIPVSASISAIIIAIVSRYGLREISNNIVKSSSKE